MPAVPDTNGPDPPRRVVVVGGGITGLAAAHRLLELDATLDVLLLEASGRLGGVLQTERRNGFLVERSADMFTTRDPWALELCRRIGLEKELIETRAEHRRAFVVRQGRLIPVPAGFSLMTPTRLWPLVTTPLLSWRGKLRLAGEYFVAARREEGDESLADFARRRLGNEVFRWLIQPVVGGIYTADPERLSMAATMRQFVEMERRHGGLIRGVQRQAGKRDMRAASGARYGMFVAPRDGMSRLIEAIAERLPADTVRLGRAVQQIEPGSEGGWRLSLQGGEPLEADALILATPAPVAARLLDPVHAELAGEVRGIPHAGAAVVVRGYRRDQLDHPADGFGFVVPLAEGRRILAGSFASVKFAGRAAEEHLLLRTFVGGACQPELLQLSDAQIERLVDEELGQLLGARGRPLFSEVVRWENTMPQYHVGHLDRVRRIEAHVESLPGLELCGNAYRGVGIPFCVHDGERAAESLLNRRAEDSRGADALSGEEDSERAGRSQAAG